MRERYYLVDIIFARGWIDGAESEPPVGEVSNSSFFKLFNRAIIHLFKILLYVTSEIKESGCREKELSRGERLYRGAKIFRFLLRPINAHVFRNHGRSPRQREILRRYIVVVLVRRMMINVVYDDRIVLCSIDVTQRRYLLEQKILSV